MPSVATTQPSPRAVALEALAGPDPERGLELAMPLLLGTTDVALLLEIAKAMVRAGLAGIAVRTLRAVGAAEPGSQLAPLVAQLERLPSGELDQAALASRWVELRQALVERLGDAARELPERLPAQVHLYRSAKGTVHALRDAEAGRLDFALPFEDAVARAHAVVLPPLSPTSSYCILGLPTHALLARLLAEVSPTGYEPPIDIVERDAELAALWLAALPDAAPFRGDRCTLFAGPDAERHYQRFLLRHPWRAPATSTMTVRRGGLAPPPLSDSFHAPIRQRVADANESRRTAIAERYRDRDVAWWRERYATAGRGGRRLRFVGFTSRFSTVMRHVMTGLATAFERAGCEFDAVMQPSASAAGVDVLGTLAEREYDGIVLINHLRFEYGTALPAGIPVVSWIQDYMEQLCRREAGASIGELDLVLAHSPDVLASLYGYPIGRCVGTSNLTDAAIYSDDPLPERELEPFRCDVSFVSHGSETPEQLVELIAEGNAPQMRALLLRALERIRDELRGREWMHAHRLVEVMLEAESDVGARGLTPETRRAHLYPQIARLYDRVFRQEAIRWAASWADARGRRLRLYGAGWERHPEFARFACGLVDGGRSLRALYQASRVSLQVNGHSSLHQRLLDGLAAGAFMLSRTNPADFVRAAYAGIAEGIRRHALASLAELVDWRSRDAALDAACAAAERFAGVVIRPLGDPLRDAHVRATAAGNSIEGLCSDSGLFEILRDFRLIPLRVAGDIPGFAETCFGSERAMHALLDRFVDDEAARRAVSAPMRASVMLHDTYDGLVSRVLERFGASTGAGR